MRNLIWDKTWFHLPIKCYNAYIHLATKTTDTVLKGDIWTRGVNTSAAAAASYSNWLWKQRLNGLEAYIEMDQNIYHLSTGGGQGEAVKERIIWDV